MHTQIDQTRTLQALDALKLDINRVYNQKIDLEKEVTVRAIKNEALIVKIKELEKLNEQLSKKTSTLMDLFEAWNKLPWFMKFLIGYEPTVYEDYDLID